jgi:hypothetical protein
LVTIKYYSTTIYYLPGIPVSLALYPHNVNKFVLIVSNFYVAKVLSQQKLLYTCIELSRGSNGFLKPLLDPDGGFNSETAERRFQK